MRTIDQISGYCTASLVVIMTAPSSPNQHGSPIWRLCVAISALAGFGFVLLLALPTTWIDEWYLFLAATAASCVAVVLALLVIANRRSEELAGIAVGLAGVNILAVVIAVVVLFNFRMGAP